MYWGEEKIKNNENLKIAEVKKKKKNEESKFVSDIIRPTVSGATKINKIKNKTIGRENLFNSKNDKKYISKLDV